MKKKVCLVTTTRADYGIMSRLIKKILRSDRVDFFLIASGSHLSQKHGMTIREIERDGVPIYKALDIGLDDIGDDDIEQIMANALTSFTGTFKELRPDIVVLLGDRYEAMAVALACTICNIPVAHIHGGETTEGAMDEVFRHAITKAAHLHFTSCETYRQRVIQLGEDPRRVFNTGALGVENALTIPLLGREALAKELSIKFDKKNILVTFHPATFEPGQAKRQVDELLLALEKLVDTTVIITRPNADAENAVINQRIDAVASTSPFMHVFSSLGATRYLSLLNIVDAVVGNSSSGIIEAPSFHCATINVGDRQKGRIQAESIINCEPDHDQISAALQKIYTPDFKNTLKSCRNPYTGANPSSTIVKIIEQTNLSGITRKHFYDKV